MWKLKNRATSRTTLALVALGLSALISYASQVEAAKETFNRSKRRRSRRDGRVIGGMAVLEAG
jgi:hypothetical protein